AGIEEFMRTYYGHAGTIARVSETVISRCVQVPEPYRAASPVRTIREGMRIQGRTLSVTGRELFATDPVALVQVFAEAQRHGVTLSPSTRDLIRECAPALAPVLGTPAVSAAFLDIVRARGHVYETL